MPQLKRSKIDGRKYPWPHNAMVQPIRPIAAPLFAKAPKRPAAAFWGDPDRDGVMNAFDCAPHNRRRQGPQHEDQLGIGKNHDGEKKASLNITKITKQWKSEPVAEEYAEEDAFEKEKAQWKKNRGYKY